jgi:hypothetical protein
LLYSPLLGLGRFFQFLDPIIIIIIICGVGLSP